MEPKGEMELSWLGEDKSSNLRGRLDMWKKQGTEGGLHEQVRWWQVHVSDQFCCGSFCKIKQLEHDWLSKNTELPPLYGCEFGPAIISSLSFTVLFSF